MYSGLPIVTNKIPEHERNGIPHHLIDQIGLGETPWTVNGFVEETSRIITGIRERGKVPVVVGGTNYYVFSLLFEEATLGVDPDDSGGRSDKGSDSEAEKVEMDDDVEVAVVENVDVTNGNTTTPDLSILDEPTDVVLAKLRELDPIMADSWHPRDRRKIQRSLEICLKSGRKASEIYEEQNLIRRQQSISTLEAPTLRYKPLIFWLEAEDAVLKDRLNTRVDVMVKEGLLDEVQELRAFADEATRKGVVLNKRKGIWIAIGYKELEPWLDARQNESTDLSKITSLKDAGVEDIKASTRQYAKRQHRWIRIRLAQHLKSANMLDRLFLLDGTDLQAWEQMVAEPSESVTEQYLSGLPLAANNSLSTMAAQTFAFMQGQDKVSGRQARHCETCQKTLMTEEEWTKHIMSRRHKKVVEGIKRRTLLESGQYPVLRPRRCTEPV